MKRLPAVGTRAVTILALTACFPWDAGGRELDDTYELHAIDTRQDMALYRRLPDGNGIGRIEPTVFAVGWDSSHLIAKRHPSRDRSHTEYYILERRKDSPHADPNESVRGPFDSLTFHRERSRLGVDSQLRFQHIERDLE
jgi:hypothetical protein